jgi:hypothetical protein
MADHPATRAHVSSKRRLIAVEKSKLILVPLSDGAKSLSRRHQIKATVSPQPSIQVTRV